MRSRENGEQVWGTAHTQHVLLILPGNIDQLFSLLLLPVVVTGKVVENWKRKKEMKTVQTLLVTKKSFPFLI